MTWRKRKNTGRGIVAPWPFGRLIDLGSRLELFGGNLIASALVIAAAAIEIIFGVAAEQASVEKIAASLSSVDPQAAQAGISVLSLRPFDFLVPRRQRRQLHVQSHDREQRLAATSGQTSVLRRHGGLPPLFLKPILHTLIPALMASAR